MEFASKRINKILLACLILIVGLMPLFFLCSCEPVTSEYIVNNLFPNLWVFIAHVLSTGVLFSVMFWFVWKPAKKTLQKRHDYIANEIKDAEKSRKAASIQLAEANQLKVEALTQAMTIKTQAQAEALNIVAKAKTDAKAQSEALKQSAKNDIERQKQEIQAAAQDNIINIAFDVAGTILNKEVSKQDKDKYIDELLASISQELKNNK